MANSVWVDRERLSVCVSVYVSVTALQPKRLGRFWWNFKQILRLKGNIYIFIFVEVGVKENMRYVGFASLLVHLRGVG